MRFDGNLGREKNYEPNSFSGPSQTGEPLYGPVEVHGWSGTHEWDDRQSDDFAQAGSLYRLMSDAEKDRLVESIAGSLSQVQRTSIGEGIVARSVEHFRRADADYGTRIEAAVAAQRS